MQGTASPSLSTGSTDAAQPLQDRIEQASGAAHHAVDKAASTAEEAVASVRPFISRTAQTAHQTVDKVTATVAPAADWFAKQSEALAAKSRTAEADARAFVVAHPWKAIGAVASLAYLLGRLTRR